MEKFFENIVSNPKFLYSAFYDYTNQQAMETFRAFGCPLKTERGERVFPVSDHASDVIAALERALKKKGVKISLNTAVRELMTDGERVTGVILSNGNGLPADAVVVATGGLSYPSTGSTGEGFRMAKALGHTVKECVPALVPMNVEEEWCRQLQGLSLKNVTLTLLCGKKQIYQGFGEMLFTHFGISGPLVLSASSFYGRCKDRSQVRVVVDLKPALTEEQLDKRILREFEQNLNKQFKNVIGALYPSKMTPVVIKLCGIDENKKIHEITKEERKRLIQVTKQLTMTVDGLRDFNEAIITQGGVSVKEVNPSTMESKLIRGLYFAGEILDVDALTGGFNLQIAWSTGHLAGSSIKDTGKE
jgi:hypothetical protein